MSRCGSVARSAACAPHAQAANSSSALRTARRLLHGASVSLRTPRRLLLRPRVESRHFDDDALVRAFANAVALVVRPDAEGEPPPVDLDELGVSDDVQPNGR